MQLHAVVGVLLLRPLLNEGKNWRLIGAACEREIHSQNRTLYSAKIKDIQ